MLLQVAYVFAAIDLFDLIITHARVERRLNRLEGLDLKNSIVEAVVVALLVLIQYFVDLLLSDFDGFGPFAAARSGLLELLLYLLTFLAGRLR